MLNDRLVQLRKEKKKTQEDVAKVIGVTRPAYTAYEKGNRTPDYDILESLADYFDVSTDYLLGRTDNRNFINLYEDEEIRRAAIMNKIATEFPDIDLMFKDIEDWTTEDFEELYDYIKFKQSQKEKGY